MYKLLLHGALGSKSQLAGLYDRLSSNFEMHSFNFSGHGGNAINQDFSIDLFVRETLSYLDSQSIETIDIFGYSMGGYVALKLAHDYPDRVNKIITLGTKFAWTPESANKEVMMLNPEIIEMKVPKFAEALAQRHQPQNWKEIMLHTARMMKELGNGKALKEKEFREIQHEVLVCVGSADNMVSQEESVLVTQWLPNGHFKLIQDFKHPIELIDEETLSEIISEFMP